MSIKKNTKPQEEILIEDLKDLDKLLQVCKRDLETVKNKSKIIRELLVISRDNLSEAIKRLDELVEEI
jgi:hypothetical protein